MHYTDILYVINDIHYKNTFDMHNLKIIFGKFFNIIKRFLKLVYIRPTISTFIQTGLTVRLCVNCPICFC